MSAYRDYQKALSEFKAMDREYLKAETDLEMQIESMQKELHSLIKERNSELAKKEREVIRLGKAWKHVR